MRTKVITEELCNARERSVCERKVLGYGFRKDVKEMHEINITNAKENYYRRWTIILEQTHINFAKESDSQTDKHYLFTLSYLPY